MCERDVSRPQRQQPVGNAGSRLERYGTARGKRRRHPRGACRLDADDPDGWTHLFDSGAYPRNLSAAADGHVDRPDVRLLLEDLHARRALPGDDPRVIEGRHDRESARGRDLFSPRLAIGGGGSGEDDFCAMPPHTFHLDAGRRLGHHDDGWRSERFCHERDGPSMIAGRVSDDAGRPGLGRELRNHVARTPDLEGPTRLEAFALQPQAGLKTRLSIAATGV